MGEKCIQHNPASEHPVNIPDFDKVTIGNLAQRLKEITDNPELAPEEKRAAFWENFNTLTDYPPGLDNRFYWLMDIQKLLIGANSLEKLLENSTDQVDPEHTMPEVLRNYAALTFEQHRASFDGIAPDNSDNQQLPSSRVFEKAWHAAKELQPEPAKPADICITPVLLLVTSQEGIRKFEDFDKLLPALSPEASAIQEKFYDAHQLKDSDERKTALLSVVGEDIAKLSASLEASQDSETTLFTAFLKLRAAQVTHDLAELGYYGQEVENIRQRAVAIKELSELITSLENDTRYNTEDPDKAQNLHTLAKYYHWLYGKEQKALEITPPTNPADHLGAVAVSDTTTLQHAA